MRYRLYIDESGDHSSSDFEAIGKRYLGLVGVMFQQSDPYEEFRARLEEFKRKHLRYDPDDPPILHRDDVVKKQGAFTVLHDEEKCAAFDEDLLSLIENANFRVIMVVIDKVEHWEKKYREVRHPYHYCMQAMMERYCGWLRHTDNKGDVMAESRGGAEDAAFKSAYEDIYEWGTYYLSWHVAQKRLTSRRVKIKPKWLNIAGLQLADILAHPLKRDVLVAEKRISDCGSEFADKIARIVRLKYNQTTYWGRIRGYGRILLT